MTYGYKTAHTRRLSISAPSTVSQYFWGHESVRFIFTSVDCSTEPLSLSCRAERRKSHLWWFIILRQFRSSYQRLMNCTSHIENNIAKPVLKKSTFIQNSFEELMIRNNHDLKNIDNSIKSIPVVDIILIQFVNICNTIHVYSINCLQLRIENK